MIVFSSSDDSLHKASIQYLEAKLVNMSFNNPRLSLTNNNIPTPPSLSEKEKAVCDGFLRELLLCLPVIGINLEYPREDRTIASQDYHLKAKGVEAKGMQSPNEFIVFKGSEAVSISLETPSIPSGTKAKRKQLMEKGILIESSKEVLIFTEDYPFSSPSTASSVILGASSNGRDLWKTKEGMTLNSVEALNKENDK